MQRYYKTIIIKLFMNQMLSKMSKHNQKVVYIMFIVLN